MLFLYTQLIYEITTCLNMLHLCFGLLIKQICLLEKFCDVLKQQKFAVFIILSYLKDILSMISLALYQCFLPLFMWLVSTWHGYVYQCLEHITALILYNPTAVVTFPTHYNVWVVMF